MKIKVTWTETYRFETEIDSDSDDCEECMATALLSSNRETLRFEIFDINFEKLKE